MSWLYFLTASEIHGTPPVKFAPSENYMDFFKYSVEILVTRAVGSVPVTWQPDSDVQISS